MKTCTLSTPLKTLLRGEPGELASLLKQPLSFGQLAPFIACIALGCGAYGASIGLWRAPLQALFVAVKMPLLILLTLTINGLLNGMLAQVLGSGLSFRQTLRSCLMCFAIFGLIVGSLSPIVIGMVLDAPPPGHADASEWYRLFLLTHTAVIAFAGIVANHKLLRLLQAFAGSAQAARHTLIAWLAGNLFVGAQLSFNLRPFFGNPELPVQFLRDHPFGGNFYIAVGHMLMSSLNTIVTGFLGPLLAILTVVFPGFIMLRLVRSKPRTCSLTPNAHHE